MLMMTVMMIMKIIGKVGFGREVKPVVVGKKKEGKNGKWS